MPTDTTFGGIPDGGHRTAANPLPMKHILSYTRRALDDYGMIRSGERIAVGDTAVRTGASEAVLPDPV